MESNASVALPAPEDTRMFREAGEAAEVVARQFERNAGVVRGLAQRLRASPPPFIVTCARGSSDHAATFGKYLFETRLGRVTASASPSVASVYAARPQVRDALFLAVSQSGKSPDLVRNAEIAREGTRLGVDFAATVSCYQADEKGRACAHCDACRLRAEGFRDAGLLDPTRYR